MGARVTLFQPMKMPRHSGRRGSERPPLRTNTRHASVWRTISGPISTSPPRDTTARPPSSTDRGDRRRPGDVLGRLSVRGFQRRRRLVRRGRDRRSRSAQDRAHQRDAAVQAGRSVMPDTINSIAPSRTLQDLFSLRPPLVPEVRFLPPRGQSLRATLGPIRHRSQHPV